MAATERVTDRLDETRLGRGITGGAHDLCMISVTVNNVT
jgi:hypothetical protein